MKIALSFVMYFGLALALRAQPSVDDLMAIFSAPEKAAMEKLYNKATALKNQNPGWMAMAGFAGATLADHEWSPYAKLQRFNEGKALLEKSVAQAPNDPVIRLMRLMIQLECPFFLDYRSAIDSDLQMLAAACRKTEAVVSPAFKYKTLAYLANQKNLSAEQKALFKTGSL